MSQTVSALIQQAAAGQTLSRAEVLALLEIPVAGAEYYALLAAANDYARRTFENQGIVFAQIGLDAQPCRINCKFCSLSQDAMQGKPHMMKSLDETVSLAAHLAACGIQDLFLMTTAEFGAEEFLTYLRAVRAAIPADMRLVANTSDFDLSYANALKEAGATGVYHVHRLGEGVDTGATTAARLRTMDAVRDAGLVLYYCVEPIGPEHTPEQLADEIVRARDYPVEVMAVMKRICVPGTPLASRGEISAATLAKICAVTILAVRPPRAMCVHEPDELCLMAGANQLYAECGVNPRDAEKDTASAVGRGFSVTDAQKMLRNAAWNA